MWTYASFSWCRQLALGFLKRHGVAMCRGATVDAIRKLYEVVSEQSARPTDDGAQGAGRLQVRGVFCSPSAALLPLLRSSAGGHHVRQGQTFALLHSLHSQ